MSAAAYARRYCELGLALTWSPPGRKGPRHTGWKLSENAITDPQRARDYWSAHPDYGIGALLSYSGLVSFDVDDVEHTQAVLSRCGVDLDTLSAPRIVGNPAKFRLMYRAPATLHVGSNQHRSSSELNEHTARAVPTEGKPANVPHSTAQELKHRTLSWPRQNDLRKTFAVFELRAGPISDAMPPTIHQGTGRPYQWAVPPRGGFPPLPECLLSLWLDWERFERFAKECCPWAPAISLPARKLKSSNHVEPGESVITAFNRAHDVVAILEAAGYQRRGKRFASPDTGHAAGVVLLESGRIYCHHQGDPLGGGVARDAFDVWCSLEYAGDVRAAVRAAAEALGMSERRRA